MGINDNCPKCNYPDVGPGENYKGIYNPGQPCPYCKYNELGKDPKVSDLGRHQTLKKEYVESIRNNFLQIYQGMKDTQPEHLVLQLARQCIGYLELPEEVLRRWYERS